MAYGLHVRVGVLAMCGWALLSNPAAAAPPAADDLAAAASEVPMDASEQAAPVFSPATPAPTETPAERAIRQWRERLGGSAWSVEMRPMSGEGKPVKDTVTFEDRQVTSDRLAKEGFGSSNFSLRVEGDAAIWETMQSKDGAAAFWRGEVMGETLRGVLSKKAGDGPSEDFSFNGAPMSGYTAPTPSVATPVVEAAAPGAPSVPQMAAPAAAPPAARPKAPQAQPPAKKKRGWF